MVYVGLSYYGPVLGSNEYLSFFLSSVIEIPSCLFCWFIMDRWGRRWPLTLSMLLSGISCIITVLLPEGNFNKITNLTDYIFSSFDFILFSGFMKINLLVNISIECNHYTNKLNYMNL